MKMGKGSFFLKLAGKWKLVENEVHTDSNFGQNVYRIEPNGDMTFIAGIDKEGKREERPNGSQMTWEKIKSKPVKELTLREKVIGTYELKKDGITGRAVLLENGVYEWYVNGKKEAEEGKWKVVNGEIHVETKDGRILVLRINKDKSITNIAHIGDGERKDFPKENLESLKKIK